MIKLIQDEIKEEEAKLRRRIDFLDNLGQIYQLANKTFQKIAQSKRRKLDKLLKGCKQKKEQQKKKEGNKKKKKRNPSQGSPRNPPIKTVINLSNIQLSPAEVSLLEKGLSFCPKPPRPNTFELKKDLQEFSRRLRLKEFLKRMITKRTTRSEKSPVGHLPQIVIWP